MTLCCKASPVNRLQETAAVRDKIKVILSRVAALEKVFEQPARDGAEKTRQEELLTYVIDLHSNRGAYRFPVHSKLSGRH